MTKKGITRWSTKQSHEADLIRAQRIFAITYMKKVEGVMNDGSIHFGTVFGVSTKHAPPTTTP